MKATMAAALILLLALGAQGAPARRLLQDSPAPADAAAAVSPSPAAGGVTASPAPEASPAVASPAEGESPAAAGGAGAPLPGTLEGAGGAGGNASFPTLADAAAAAPPNISTLLAAVNAVNLTGPLSDPNTTWTIFAPTDAAFETLLTTLNLTNATLFAPEQNGTLINILSYHVVPNVSLTAAELQPGPLPTLLNGAELNVTITPGGNVTLTGGQNSTATVVVPDLKAGNSTIHIIDAVLLPPNNATGVARRRRNLLAALAWE